MLEDNIPEVSIVSPVFGCRSCLEELVDRVSAAMVPTHKTFEIVLVDDASPDDSWSRIVELSHNNPAVKGIRLSRNFGQHAAISAGVIHAKGREIVVMDCDLQDAPEEIPRLLQALGPTVHVAVAQRMERQDSPLKKLGSWVFYQLMGWLTASDYDHRTANFGAYDRKVIEIVNAMPEADRFFPLLVKWTGFRAALVPVEHGRRDHGKSGYSFRQLVRLALNVALSFSDKPLRMVVKIGLTFSAIALAVVVYSVYRYSVGDIQVAGFTSIIASVWLVGSVILSSVGVVGLYLGRLYNHAKNRPHFIVAELSEQAV